jgi:hypothetical protein
MPTQIEIVIAPAGDRTDADVFTAHWGDRRLATSRTPFFESARKLLELGADPGDVLIMRHRGSDTVSLRARVGVAAKLRVKETAAGPRYVPWTDPRSIWATEDATEDAA